MTMEDDELRKRIAEAHGDDAPPPFAAVLGRARRRRRPWALVLVPLAAVAALLLLWLRPHAPPPSPSLTASLSIEFKDPLAFLLEPPAGDVLRTVPQFDRGDLP